MDVFNLKFAAVPRILGRAWLLPKTVEPRIGGIGIAIRLRALLVGGHYCSRKKLLGAPGLTTRSKDATRGSWHRY